MYRDAPQAKRGNVLVFIYERVHLSKRLDSSYTLCTIEL